MLEANKEFHIEIIPFNVKGHNISQTDKFKAHQIIINQGVFPINCLAICLSFSAKSKPYPTKH